MSNHKLQCPICNQEFPAYDQRGFRNAGFTSHHNWCLERQQQQQSDHQQQDKQSSRASRFAMAIRRRLLPAQPVSLAPTSTVIEAYKRNSISVLPRFGPGIGFGSHSQSSSSPSLHPSHVIYSQHTTPIVPSQAPLHHQPIPRQRHTWNHWNKGRETRRSTSISSQDKICSPAMSPSLPQPTILPLALTPDPPHSIAISSCRVVYVTNDTTKDPDFPLLTTITATNSTAPSIITQTTSTHTSTLPINSPTLPGNSPFSFISMLTTLPLESTSLEQSINTLAPTSISNMNFNNLENTTRHHHPPMYSSAGMQQMGTITSDWTMNNRSVPRNDSSLHQSSLQQHHQDQQHANYHTHLDSSEQHHGPRHNQSIDHHNLLQQHLHNQHRYASSNQIADNDISYLQHFNLASTSTVTTCVSMTHPINQAVNTNQFQIELQDSSSSLLEFIIADLMRNEDSDGTHS